MKTTMLIFLVLALVSVTKCSTEHSVEPPKGQGVFENGALRAAASPTVIVGVFTTVCLIALFNSECGLGQETTTRFASRHESKSGPSDDASACGESPEDSAKVADALSAMSECNGEPVLNRRQRRARVKKSKSLESVELVNADQSPVESTADVSLPSCEESLVSEVPSNNSHESDDQSLDSFGSSAVVEPESPLSSAPSSPSSPFSRAVSPPNKFRDSVAVTRPVSGWSPFSSSVHVAVSVPSKLVAPDTDDCSDDETPSGGARIQIVNPATGQVVRLGRRRAKSIARPREPHFLDQSYVDHETRASSLPSAGLPVVPMLPPGPLPDLVDLPTERVALAAVSEHAVNMNRKFKIAGEEPTPLPLPAESAFKRCPPSTAPWPTPKPPAPPEQMIYYDSNSGEWRVVDGPAAYLFVMSVFRTFLQSLGAPGMMGDGRREVHA